MTIEFQCPNCTKQLRVKDELAGKQGKCPDCKNAVKVPTSSAAPKAPSAPTVAPTVAPVVTTTPKPKPPAAPSFVSPDAPKPSVPDANPFAAIATPNPSSQVGARGHGGTLVLKSVDIASCAMMGGVNGALTGLLVGIPFGILFILGGTLGNQSAMPAGIIGGLMALFVPPLFYGLVGLVGGAIGGVIYNVAAHFTGGLKFKTG